MIHFIVVVVFLGVRGIVNFVILVVNFVILVVSFLGFYVNVNFVILVVIISSVWLSVLDDNYGSTKYFDVTWQVSMTSLWHL